MLNNELEIKNFKAYMQDQHNEQVLFCDNAPVGKRHAEMFKVWVDAKAHVYQNLEFTHDLFRIMGESNWLDFQAMTDKIHSKYDQNAIVPVERFSRSFAFIGTEGKVFEYAHLTLNSRMMDDINFYDSEQEALAAAGQDHE